KASARNRAGHWRGIPCRLSPDCTGPMRRVVAIADDVEYLGDRERIIGRDDVLDVLPDRAARAAEEVLVSNVFATGADVVVAVEVPAGANENLPGRCPPRHGQAG